MYLVISGGGKVGTYLASVMLEAGHEVAIIEQDRETADRLSESLHGRYLVILGDGCDSKCQEEAGVRRADSFIATTGHDDANLVSCEIAMRVFRVPRCIARVNDPRNIRIFREVGIESISSTTLIASIIEEETTLGSVSIVNTLSHGNVVMAEIGIPRMVHHSNTEGVRVGDLLLPADSLVVAVSTPDDTQVANPDTVLFPGDKVVVVADSEAMPLARATFKQL